MSNAPLADKLRPQTLEDVCGQQHLLAKGKVFRKAIESGKTPNMIFYGPSGVGKTTVARIIAQGSGMQLHKLNGTNASTADIKSVIAQYNTLNGNKGILLYLDEIQYLNKKQQQSLLECIEDGSVTLIASTTENPYFYVYSAILSRCTVFEFKHLTAKDVQVGIEKAIAKLENQLEVKIEMQQEAIVRLSFACGGDMRKALGSLEFAVSASDIVDGKIFISQDMIEQVAKRSSMQYDKNQDNHYDALSGLQKSIRGSDPNGAVHYLARILEGGDMPSACRRLLVIAAEDIGLAYPQAIPIVKACVDSALQIGMPEARIPLADAAVLLATSPKSNSAYVAYDAAVADIRSGNSGDIPRHLQNTHFDGEDALIKGKHYLYPHDFENHWVEQQYLPNNLKNRQYYTFGENKTEQMAKNYWDKIKNK